MTKTVLCADQEFVPQSKSEAAEQNAERGTGRIQELKKALWGWGGFGLGWVGLG